MIPSSPAAPRAATPRAQACAALREEGQDGVGALLAAAVQPPEASAVASALANLVELGAVRDGAGESLTPLGHHLASLPLDARLGKMILFGAVFRCLDPVLCIAASLSYKSPLLQPFGQRDQARMAQERFSRAHRSDHLAVWEAYREWDAITRAEGQRAASRWCDAFFVSNQSMRMIAEMMRSFRQLLVGSGFAPREARAGGGGGGGGGTPGVPSGAPDDPNAHAANVGLVRAVLCAGLYPNIAHVQYSTGGKGVGKARMLEKSGEVLIHPSSCAHRRESFESDWVVYHEKVRTTRVFIRECSTVPLQAILLFALHVEVLHASCAVVIDRWVKISANPRTAVLFKTLRTQLNSLLEAKMKDRHRSRRAALRHGDGGGSRRHGGGGGEGDELLGGEGGAAARAAQANETAIIQNIASLLAEPEPATGAAQSAGGK